MATPLEEERKHLHRGSSSSNEDGGEGGGNGRGHGHHHHANNTHTVPPPALDGLPQTGPKGVLTDFYRAQEERKRLDLLEKSRREELLKQHMATVKPHSEEKREEEEEAMMNLAKALDTAALDQDPFIQQYRGRRLQEMKDQAKLGAARVLFGNLVEIRGDKYASVIDSAPPQTYVVLHLYDELLPSCKIMNKCLTKLAKKYQTVKFCRVQSFTLGVSDEFEKNGLPALLVYKRGEMLGNFPKITNKLGEDFTPEDVEIFLHEKNCLPPESEASQSFVP